MSEKQYVTLDGNEAAARMAYQFTEIAAIYPITPSSPMAGLTDAWSAKGKLNMFGQRVKLVEMQSEAGAVAAVHGALQSGALATTFTSSQGLMLMIPVLHRIAGERLPAVLHVAARTVGTHAMSIFGDHSDVMNCRQTGCALLSTGSVQEVMDIAAVAHLAAIKSRIPFIHFFDGFRTSHEINKVELMADTAVTGLVDKEALSRFRNDALNPEHPVLRNTVQNPDVYFQIREANNKDYAALPDVVEEYLQRISAICGREYHLFNYYGDKEATDVIIAMGSVSGAIHEAVDALTAEGKKVGYLQVHLYRPFSAAHFINALPKSVKRIAVLDRCKEMGSIGEPLYEDVCTALMGRNISVVGGRYGLSSKDADPAQIAGVFANLEEKDPIKGFTIGINDDVTHLSLAPLPIEGKGGGTVQCKFWGLGSDGTVGANHHTVRIINDTTDMFAQAYFEYDAKKSFGVTRSHLRFSSKPIESSYYVKEADFVACHNESFIFQYDIAGELRHGGKFLLNCSYHEEELESRLPAQVRRILAQKQARLYIIDATAIAEELGLGAHSNTVLQSAFFTIMDIIPQERALEEMKRSVREAYFNKGDEVIARNIAAIDSGAARVKEVNIPGSWSYAKDEGITGKREALPDAVTKLLFPINRQEGDKLPVSNFLDYKDGRMAVGMTAYEKRGIAISIPKWDSAKCLQCNRCSLVCPHAVIRPYLLDEAEKNSAPSGFATVAAKGAQAKGYYYTLQVSAYDCTGCGSCVSVCPASEKAIAMTPACLTEDEKRRWEYGLGIADKGELFPRYTVKGSQFRQPLVEFSAACAGCGETPYAKLLTQLFGDRAYWINATGCSQAWGAPMPGIPYTVNKRGFGPAWSNSLFENNAEFGLGMFLSVSQQRSAQRSLVEEYTEACGSAAGKAWLEAYDDSDASRTASDALIEELENSDSPYGEKILARKDQLAKKSFWMFGGDGWAYDIGFGGLDHVVAGGEDINAFVIDTEVYSNTGGQSSKATQLGAVAQFDSSGKRSRKKDLGAIFRTYNNVYVASVAMGADPDQLIRAIKEAEAHKGPSVIIAYTPCSAHGIRKGMGSSQQEMKRAVDAGYWTLYRYDPDKDRPMTLDSPRPSLDYEEFLDGENRYSALKRTFPQNAKMLFKEAADNAMEQYRRYNEQAQLSGGSSGRDKQ